MDAQCGNTKYPLIENIPELNSSHESPYTRVLHDSTVLLHLLFKNSALLLCFIETLLRCFKCICEFTTPRIAAYRHIAHLEESTCTAGSLFAQKPTVTNSSGLRRFVVRGPVLRHAACTPLSRGSNSMPKPTAHSCCACVLTAYQKKKKHLGHVP